MMDNAIKKAILDFMFDESLNYGDPDFQVLYDNCWFLVDDEKEFAFNKNDGRFIAVGEIFESWGNIIGYWSLNIFESSDYYMLFFDNKETNFLNVPPLIVSPIWRNNERTELYCKVDYDYEKDGSNKIIIYQDGSWEYLPPED